MLRSLHRSSDAIAALIELLDAIPTDAEAWCELADLYQAQGLGAQAIFSLEEALLVAPNAWNVRISLVIPRPMFFSFPLFFSLSPCVSFSFLWISINHSFRFILDSVRSSTSMRPRLTGLDLQANQCNIFVEALNSAMTICEASMDWLWSV